IELTRQRVCSFPAEPQCSVFSQKPNNGDVDLERGVASRCKAATGTRLAWIGADPAGLQRSDQTGISTIAHWRRAGFVIRTLPTTIEAGIETVRARLRSADGAIGLRIHRRCRQLIRALREYHFDPKRPASETPVKDGPDHAADALRYLIVNLDGPA